MAYTPKTWTTGETITAAELNAIEQAASAAAAVADTANTGLAGKVNSSTYTAALAGKAPQLVPTATKTAAYTAAVGDLAVMNVAGGATALTLPTAPADKSMVGFLAIGATTATPLTVNRGGADTVGPSGATSVTAPLANESTVYQYDAPNTRWLAVSNVKPLSALDARYPVEDTSGRVGVQRVRQLSGLRAQPIATGGGMPDSFGTSSVTTGYTSRTPYKIAVDATDIQLTWPMGWYLNSGGAVAETALGAQVPGIKASVELADGTIWPVFFAGTRTINCDSWGNVTSDPVAVDVKAGDVIYVRTFVNVPNGAFYPQMVSPYGPGITYNGVVGFTSAGDFSDSGGTFTSSTTRGYWSPIVTGQPLGTPKPIIAVVGDSISVGTGSTGGVNAFWKYGLNNTLPAVVYARSGILAQGIAANHRRGFPLLQGATHAFVLLGTNDFQGRTLAQLKTDLLTIWANLAGRGMKVYGATLPPNTTSTDSFATTANQTVRAAESTVRVPLNDWIRTLPAPLTGYFDFGDVLETARNSGLWKVNGTASYATADGIHPSDVMHQAMGAVIPVASLTP